ncbi:MAG: tripartite tricarboxylate transporter substrate binding protein [Chloroflexota bacterium]
MLHRRIIRLCMTIGLLVALATLAAVTGPAAGYPTKPVTLIIPFKAGSAPDTTFRFLAELVEKDLGQKIVVMNRPGPGGTIGVSEVLQARPDGHTIGMAAVAVVVLQPLLQDLPFKGPDDMTLIAQTNEAQTALAVNASSPWKTVDEFLAEARRRPGQLSVGLGGGFHTILHVQIALLEKQTGVRLNVVPFDAGAQLPALLGGSVDAVVGQTVLLSPHVKAGKVRPLAQVGVRRARGWEGIPTLKELGHDITVTAYEFVIAPKGTPKPVADKLSAAFKKASESPAFREFGDRRGLEIRPLGPADLTERLRVDAKVYRQVVEELGWAKKK